MDGISLTDVEDDDDALTEDSENYGRVGVTFGDVGTTELECNICSPVDKGEYVQMEHPTVGWVLGQIDSIERKTDVSIDKAIQITKGEEVDIEDTLVAKINVIGYRDENGLLKIPGSPFKAGENIYLADEKLIRDVMGLHEDQKGAYVGKLRGHDIKVNMNINAMAQKHISVLAKTGSGKSYTTGILIEELMKHNVTLVVLDPHGEYSSLAKAGNPKKSKRFDVKPKGYGDKLTEFSPSPDINKSAQPLKFTFRNMEPKKILELGGLDKRQTYVKALESSMSNLAVSKGDFSVNDVIRVLQSNEEDNQSTLIRGLEDVKQKRIFDERGTRMDEIVNKGKTSIINLKGTPPDLQGFIVNKLMGAIFELRKRKRIPPLILVAEEAHNFCPQRGKVESSETFKTVASEGRKFGMGLAIITQRPAKVDKNVLSQCNTQIILKMTNPNDLRAVESSVEGITKGMKEEIQRLPVGEAILSGGGLSEPLLVQVRPRETQDGGQSIKLVD
ncbi:MAG: ATP-binding protein [Thermoplasmatota archaeon]